MRAFLRLWAPPHAPQSAVPYTVPPGGLTGSPTGLTGPGFPRPFALPLALRLLLLLRLLQLVRPPLGLLPPLLRPVSLLPLQLHLLALHCADLRAGDGRLDGRLGGRLPLCGRALRPNLRHHLARRSSVARRGLAGRTRPSCRALPRANAAASATCLVCCRRRHGLRAWDRWRGRRRARRGVRRESGRRSSGRQRQRRWRRRRRRGRRRRRRQPTHHGREWMRLLLAKR